MHGRASAALAAVVAALLLLAAPAGAATINVVGTADTPPDAQCAENDCPSIRSALVTAAALPGADTLLLPAGDYRLDYGELNVDSDVTIRGEWAGTTIVYGNGLGRVFAIAAGVTASIAHLTMRDGAVDESSGCFGGNLINRGTLLLDHVRATNGNACSGGGISNAAGTMTIESSLIDHNTALAGGADSGGIQNFGSRGSPGVLTVRDSTVAFNTTGLGGGIMSWSFEGDVPNVTTLERVTVAYNSAIRRGIGGLMVGDASQSFHVHGSIVASNTADGAPSNCAGVLPSSDGGNVESAGDCGFGAEGDTQNADPKLSSGLLDRGSPDTQVLELGPGSAAVDRFSCEGRDQRELARPQGSGCDAGAYEAWIVSIDSGPEGLTNDNRPVFTFSSSQATSFSCRWDDGSSSPCQSGDPAPYAFGDGQHAFFVQGYSGDTPIGDPATRTFVVDATPPEPPTVDLPADGTLQRCSEVMFSGTGAERGASVTVSEDGVAKGGGIADAVGGWSFWLVEEADGRHTYEVRVVDAAGNRSDPVTRTVTVDSTAPAPPVIEVPAGDVAQSSSLVELSGRVEAGARVEIWDGDSQRARVTAEGGRWSADFELPPGRHHLFAVAVDAAGNASGGSDERIVDIDFVAPPAPEISSPDENALLRQSTVTLSGVAEPNSTVEVLEGGLPRADAVADAMGAWSADVAGVGDGTHVYTTRATDAAGNAGPESAPRTVRVDATAPAAQLTSGPSGPTNDASPVFTFDAGEPGASFECRLDGPGGPGEFGPCTSPKSFAALAPGGYRFLVRATDGAGNSATASRDFAVAGPEPAAPTPAPAPAATPEPQRSVAGRVVSGTVLVQVGGRFVALDPTKPIPLGSIIDARNGVVEIAAIVKNGGKVERARFYDGIFKVTQTRTTTDLTLVEALAACKKGARAAAKKPTTRKLWGDGSGSFRTRGQYSAATVRGTQWLVQDSCAGTLTRVKRGVVSVRDDVRNRNVILRAGKQYLARP